MCEVEKLAGEYCRQYKIKPNSKAEREVINAFCVAYRLGQQSKYIPMVYEPAPYWTNPCWQMPKVTC